MINNYEPIKPKDFDLKWDSWLNEMKMIEPNIEIIEDVKTTYGKLTCLFYNSVDQVKVYTRFYQTSITKPIIIYYHGHGSGIEEDWNINSCLQYVNEGYNVITIDIRDQNNKTHDIKDYQYKSYGNICKDIDKIDTTYTRGIYLDSLKIIDIIRYSNNQLFKPYQTNKIIVTGPSQGGGLALMVASINREVALCIADIPSGCCIKKRINGHYGMYTPINNVIDDYPFKKDLILNNQDYFDVVNMADKIKVPVLAAVGSIDNICPATFFIEAYDKITTKKDLYIYEGYGHGGFFDKHFGVKLSFIKKYL